MDIRTNRESEVDDCVKMPLKQWGNSQAVRIPKAVLGLLDMKQGDVFDATVNGNQITLTKVSSKNRKESELKYGQSK